MTPRRRRLLYRLKRRLAKARRWARRHLPPGVRLAIGLLLIAGGLLFFLPVLGLWMLPLGIAIASLDIAPLLRAWRKRRIARRKAEARPERGPE